MGYLSFSVSTASFIFCALSSVEIDAIQKICDKLTQIDADGLQHDVVSWHPHRERKNSVPLLQIRQFAPSYLFANHNLKRKCFQSTNFYINLLSDVARRRLGKLKIVPWVNW